MQVGSSVYQLVQFIGCNIHRCNTVVLVVRVFGLQLSCPYQRTGDCKPMEKRALAAGVIDSVDHESEIDGDTQLTLLQSRVKRLAPESSAPLAPTHFNQRSSPQRLSAGGASEASCSAMSTAVNGAASGPKWSITGFAAGQVIIFLFISAPRRANSAPPPPIPAQ